MTPTARFVLITGLSGAGKSRALAIFEDSGYYCVDNLPAALIPTFAELLGNTDRTHEKIALCVDARSGEDLLNITQYLGHVSTLGFTPETLYLDTSDEVLHRRYSESRRPHPSSPAGSIDEGIRHERLLLDPIREQADLVIDTSNMRLSELHNRIEAIALRGAEEISMALGVLSFGYKHGVPKEADLVLDVRFLPNPHHDTELRPMDGREPIIRDYVLLNDKAETFLEHLRNLLNFLIPHYAREPKSYLTIALGCTGGRHRSVAVAERIAADLRDMQYAVTLSHRDIERNF